MTVSSLPYCDYRSEHSGSALVAVTGDLNLQTKLAAVSLPFVDA